MCISTAFDSGDHTTLLTRLKAPCGLNGVFIAWFTSYLTDHTQCIRCSRSWCHWELWIMQSVISCLSCCQSCFDDVSVWMMANKLQLNPLSVWDMVFFSSASVLSANWTGLCTSHIHCTWPRCLRQLRRYIDNPCNGNCLDVFCCAL